MMSRLSYWIYSSTKSCLGLGILPPPPDLKGSVEHLKKARPVGVAQFILVENGSDKDGHRVLYMSPFLRMYGNDSTQNHHISHYVWSLRDMPGREKLTGYWRFFYPKFELANEMWFRKEGDRPIRSHKLIELVQKIKAQKSDFDLRSDKVGEFGTIRSTNSGSVEYFERWKSPIKKGDADYQGGSTPSCLKNVTPHLKDEWGWDKPYFDPAINGDLAKQPDYFLQDSDLSLTPDPYRGHHQMEIV